MKSRRAFRPSCLVLLVLGLALAAVLGFPNSAQAANPAPVDLGTAANFRALAGAAISGIGSVEGDVGSGSGAIAPAITSTGTIYSTGDAVVMTALEDFATAYNEGNNRAYTVLLSAAAYELGGQTLTSGVYKIGAAATLASPLTLDAQGNPDAVFIIQIAAALGTTAAVGNVVLANGARSENVFWIVEGAISMGAGTHMEGTILGGAAIAFGAGTTINGRVMAGSPAGTIALATTTISAPPLPPAPLGGRVWLDANGDGIQEPAETSGFAGVPVALLEIVSNGLPLDLGTAANFGALAGGAISGSGHVDENVGSGTGAIAPAITSAGTIYPTGNATVLTALNDYATAYTNGMNRTYDVLLSAAAYELGGTTLKVGTYKVGAAATLASPVTLDAEGDPDAVFVIHIVGAFGVTAGLGNVVLTNGAQSRNVFWIVEGAVSIGAGSHMEGTILGGAAITFGANATINGRALAGSAAGTVAMATTAISSVPGSPPVVKPPSNVVAETVTDANGNYLFASVNPGIYVIRWDLSSFTSDFRITAANQGGDDTLDSDGVTGDVGGFVYTAEIEFPGGTPNINVDLGLVRTLPAIQAAASEDLMTALVNYLVTNDYTAENWTALNTAMTDGNIAINAATDPAGVAIAKAAALAAMEAVPTFTETLAAAQGAALDDLTTALATYQPADYTAANWTALITVITNGDIAINAATDPAGVATAKFAALAAMDAVPTIVETLAAAKAEARNELATALANYLDANAYTADTWAALIAAWKAGNIAINGATDPAGVATAADSALVTFVYIYVPISPEAGNYYGLATPTINSTPFEHTGIFGITVLSNGRFTGKVVLNGQKAIVLLGRINAFGVAQFGNSLTATLNIPRGPLLPAQTLALSFTTGTSLAAVATGTISESGSAIVNFTANEALYTVRSNPVAPLLHMPTTILDPLLDNGVYTGVFSPLSVANQGMVATKFPQGSGYSFVTVFKNGRVLLSGKLADGAPFAAAAMLTEGNIVSFHASLYGGKGAISGLITFRDTPSQSDADGSGLTWYKPAANPSANPQPPYQLGWPDGIETDFFASKFIAHRLTPGLTQLGINPTNALITLNHTALGSAIDSEFAIAANGTTIVLDTGIPQLHLSFASNGAVNGSYRDTSSTMITNFNGVVFQKTHTASGFFLVSPPIATPTLPKQSGSMEISAQ